MTIQRILVPVEDEHFGTEVCKFIAESVWHPKSEFLVLHVVRQPHGTSILPSYAEYVELVLTASWKFVADMSSIIKQALPEAKVDEMVVEGNPKHKILEMAESWSADLIAMGSHGRTLAHKPVLLGGVSAAVCAHAPCPVLIVRERKKKPEETFDIEAATANTR